MARVEAFRRAPDGRHHLHDVARCAYLDFVAEDGKQYLVLQVYGSSIWGTPHKVTQSIQMDEVAAGRLVKVIYKTFPRLKPVHRTPSGGGRARPGEKGLAGPLA